MSVKRKALLQKVADNRGRLCANDGEGCEVAEFCNDGEPDTLNQAIDDGLLSVGHDSDSDNTTVYLTKAGRAALDQGVGE